MYIMYDDNNIINEILSHCYTLKLLAETYVQRHCKKSSGGVAPCNVKRSKTRSGTLKLFAKCCLHGSSRFLIGLRSVV